LSCDEKAALAGENESVTNCNALKMEVAYRKFRITDVADVHFVLKKKDLDKL